MFPVEWAGSRQASEGEKVPSEALVIPRCGEERWTEHPSIWGPEGRARRNGGPLQGHRSGAPGLKIQLKHLPKTRKHGRTNRPGLRRHVPRRKRPRSRHLPHADRPTPGPSRASPVPLSIGSAGPLEGTRRPRSRTCRTFISHRAQPVLLRREAFGPGFLGPGPRPAHRRRHQFRRTAKPANIKPRTRRNILKCPTSPPYGNVR